MSEFGLFPPTDPAESLVHHVQAIPSLATASLLALPLLLFMGLVASIKMRLAHSLMPQNSLWSSRFSRAQLFIFTCLNDCFTKASEVCSVRFAAVAVAIIIRMVLILPRVHSFEVFWLALPLAKHEEKYENCHDYPLEHSLWAHR